MYAQVEKSKANKSSSMAISLAQKNNDRQALQFVDNRPEAIVQRRLQEMANNSPEAIQYRSSGRQRVTADQQYAKGFTPIMQHDTTMSTIQRKAIVVLSTDEDDKKSIYAWGTVGEFQNGTRARTRGWVGVTSYRAWYHIYSRDGKYADRGYVGPLKNEFTRPEAGHVLARQNGGDGSDPENIFAQDGGSNNSTYKSFEIGMRDTLDLYHKKDKVKFKCYLKGNHIQEGIIANAALSSASDISSDESD